MICNYEKTPESGEVKNQCKIVKPNDVVTKPG